MRPIYRMKLVALLVTGASVLSLSAQTVSVDASDDTAETPSVPAGAAETAPVSADFPDSAPSIPSAGDALPPALTAAPSLTSQRPLHLRLSLLGGYDDNVNNRQDGNGSAFVNGNLFGSYFVATPRTRLELHFGGGVNYYPDLGNETDYNASLGLNLQHRFTPRLSLSIRLLSTYRKEPDFSLNTGIDRRTGYFFYTNLRLNATYLWTARFSTATSYTFNTLLHEGGNSSSDNGNSRNGVRDRATNTFGNEFRYLLLPTTTGVIEYRVQFASYQASEFDSVTHYVLLGVNHTFTPALSTSVRAGGQYRVTDMSDSLSPYFEGSLTYVLNASSVLSWVAQYGIQEGALVGEDKRENFHTGVNLNYRWTARISSRFGVFYDHNDRTSSNSSADRSDDVIHFNLSGRYAINRFWSVEAGYNYTQVMSDASVSSYSRNRAYLGVSVGF